MVMFWADIFPGARVLEAGMGSGALTLALLRAVGPEGKVVSYEQREDFCRRALANIHMRMGEVGNLDVRLRPVEEGLPEEEPVDRAVFDLPEPWQLVDAGGARAAAGRDLPVLRADHHPVASAHRDAAAPSRLRARRDLRDAAAAVEHRRARRCGRSTGWSRTPGSSPWPGAWCRRRACALASRSGEQPGGRLRCSSAGSSSPRGAPPWAARCAAASPPSW